MKDLQTYCKGCGHNESLIPTKPKEGPPRRQFVEHMEKHKQLPDETDDDWMERLRKARERMSPVKRIDVD